MAEVDTQRGFPKTIIRIQSPASGGSLTVDYRDDDVIANSLGHLGAIPSHLLLWGARTNI
ncbi:hypothetical protein HY411_00665 [Candidatus Gottesmanbacteria bacterium]|nr:hypothetical protein [Candidatus Gottesmanbacteria bacterium]